MGARRGRTAASSRDLWHLPGGGCPHHRYPCPRSRLIRHGTSGRIGSILLASPAGGYNVANAAAVLAAVVLGLGLDLHEACRALSGFGGVRRRFEKVGEANGVTVVDDYAHNPAKVAAVVSSGVRVARETEGRLIAIFQPHLYSRTRDFAEEFGRALAAADVLIVLDVYAAREDPIAGVSGSLVSDAARRAQAGDADRMILDQVTTADAAVAEVAALARAGDLVVTIGAGDVTDLGPAILDALAWGSHA